MGKGDGKKKGGGKGKGKRKRGGEYGGGRGEEDDRGRAISGREIGGE